MVEDALRRGGARQRLGALGLGGDDDGHSALANALLGLVGWGVLSSATAGVLARCALEDGANHKELRELGSIATSGAFAGNSRRDLLRRFCSSTTVPKPIAAYCRTVNRRGDIEISQQSVLSLPEVMESLWRHHPDKLFRDFLGGSPRRFWERLEPDDPNMSMLGDISTVENWRDITWPLVLHGDGGVYTRTTQSSILVVSVKSLLSKTFDCNIIPGFVLPKGFREDSAADDMWRVYVHGLNACHDGLHSESDVHGNMWPEGSPQSKLAGMSLCGGKVRLVVWILTGDLEFLSNELRFPRFDSLRPCWLCPISRIQGERFLLADVRVEAPWKDELFDINDGDLDINHPVANIKGLTRFHAPE